MKSINFDDGYRTYDINGDPDRIIKVRVTDPNINARYKAAKDELDRIFDEAAALAKLTESDLARLENGVREQLNFIFDSDICTPAFGNASMLTIDNGSTIVVNFVEALLAQVQADREAALAALKARKEEKINAYIAPITEGDLE
ncbi:MAG: hypothetical protein IJ740_08215 [Ruminococcus sp.]|nr:hypothetical protein [Ruminococcus sp.]